MTHWFTLGRGIALLLILLGGYISVMNWVTVIGTHRTGRFHSPVPLVGALFLGAGLALLAPTRHYAWAAVLVDYGTLIVLISLPMLVYEEWKTSRHNLIAGYRGSRGIMTARISLYRRSVCVIRYDMKRAPGELGIVSTGRVGTWSQDGQRLTLQVGDTSAEFELASQGEGEVLRQVSGFSGDAEELSLADVELRRQGAGR